MSHLILTADRNFYIDERKDSLALKSGLFEERNKCLSAAQYLASNMKEIATEGL